ncbi:MAG: UDP-galactopyranose mutase [Verrucomicrobia bacterium]|nr:UDP-galactopyranose mutase [Verrucomicrobiota bacterium]MDA1065127.1 UDP-galactopyranose mutase [Verrucomicrobiota bacterium]
MNGDFLIVGAGFFGSVCAERLASKGKKVLILEKRNHIGGNSWSEPDQETGIEVHTYGSHIFHTDNLKVWEYINRFTQFNNYRHTVWTTFKDKVYSMPINLGTINAYYKLQLKPHEVSAFLEEERKNEYYEQPGNLEEQAISLIGRPLYEAFIRGYTVKQWGKDPRELPAEIIQRLPVRHSYNSRYFSDPFEGIPLEGYGKLFQRLHDHPNIEVQLNTDWLDVREIYLGKWPILYTGAVDQFFDHKYGRLEWRSIELNREVYDMPDYQGCSVMNYAEADVPYTRIHEFKHFHPERPSTNRTVIYKEYSKIIGESTEPYYPVNTLRNAELLKRYKADADQLKRVWFGGRLGGYRYLDMDDTIAAALEFVETTDLFD